LSNADIRSELNKLNINNFIEGVKSDLVIAERIANSGGLSFKNPYKAVYHYRKHGEEFPKQISKYGNTMEVYLGPVKNRIIDNSNLRGTEKLLVNLLNIKYVTKLFLGR